MMIFKEIRDNSIDNNNAIDLEQIIIRVDKKIYIYLSQLIIKLTPYLTKVTRLKK